MILAQNGYAQTDQKKSDKNANTRHDTTVKNYNTRLNLEAVRIDSIDNSNGKLIASILEEQKQSDNDTNHIKEIDSSIKKLEPQKTTAIKKLSRDSATNPARGSHTVPKKQLDSLNSLRDMRQKSIDQHRKAIDSMKQLLKYQTRSKDSLAYDTLVLRRKIDNYPPDTINGGYWQKKVVYEENDQIVISFISKSQKGYDKKIFIGIRGCKIKILATKYYAKGGAPSGKDIIDSTNNIDDVMALLNGIYIDTDQINNYKKDSIIAVNCEELQNYIENLPDGFEEAIAKKNRFYIIANFAIGASGGNVFVDTGYSANADALTRRNESQRQIIGHSFGIMLGYRPPILSKTHLLYCEFIYSVMGFESRYQDIDWQTGLPGSGNDVNKSTTYKFKSFTAGLGYMYAPERDWSEGRRITLLFQIGGYYSHGIGKSNNADIDHSSEKYIVQNRFGAKAGFGLTLHVLRCLNVNILPMYQADFTALNHGQLSTKLYLKGINIGLAFH